MAQVSKKSIKKNLKEKLETNLLIALSEIKNKNEALEFLTNLLSPTEKTMLVKRLAIGLLLLNGNTYHEIINFLKVSPPTINKISQQLKKKRQLFAKFTKKLTLPKLNS